VLIFKDIARACGEEESVWGKDIFLRECRGVPPGVFLIYVFQKRLPAAIIFT